MPAATQNASSERPVPAILCRRSNSGVLVADWMAAMQAAPRRLCCAAARIAARPHRDASREPFLDLPRHSRAALRLRRLRRHRRPCAAQAAAGALSSLAATARSPTAAASSASRGGRCRTTSTARMTREALRAVPARGRRATPAIVERFLGMLSYVAVDAASDSGWDDLARGAERRRGQGPRLLSRGRARPVRRHLRAASAGTAW